MGRMSDERAISPAGAEPARPVTREAQRRADALATARLLVSDIRLYHEEEVFVGRVNRDLSVRLAVPIERARDRYVRRFPDEASAGTFDAAVIEILGGGDPTALGPRVP